MAAAKKMQGGSGDDTMMKLPSVDDLLGGRRLVADAPRAQSSVPLPQQAKAVLMMPPHVDWEGE